MRSAPAMALWRLVHITEMRPTGSLKRWAKPRNVTIRPRVTVVPKSWPPWRRATPPTTATTPMAT